MLLVKLGRYEDNPEQRQGGEKAEGPFAKVDCSVILQEMHSFFECLPPKDDVKVFDEKEQGTGTRKGGREGVIKDENNAI